MDLAWLVVVGIFMLACLTTYGFYLNVEEERREQGEVVAEHGTLTAKLDHELAAITTEASDAEVLRSFEEQELELAASCESRGQVREAELHRKLAATVAREAEAEAKVRKLG